MSRLQTRLDASSYEDVTMIDGPYGVLAGDSEQSTSLSSLDLLCAAASVCEAGQREIPTP